LGVVGIIALVIVSFTHSASDLTAAYNHATAPNAYNRVIAAAHANGVATGSSFSGFLKYLPYAAIGYFGFTAANYPAGELKRKGLVYTSMTIGGLVVTGICIVVAWLGVQHLTGQLFFQSAAGLNAANPSLLAHITNGSGISVAVYYPDLVTSNVPALIISWGVAIGYLIFNLAFALVVSRLIFALAFDRLLPSSLSDVNERTHVPTKALALGLAGCVLFTYLVAKAAGYAHTTRNDILVWSVVLTLASLAVTVLPWRRRELFEAGPKVLKGHVAGIPVIVVLGAFSVVIQAALGVIAATNTGISGGYDAVSVTVLLTMLLLGVVFYAVSRTYLKRQRGIDIDLAMRELPPE
jgi:amino acid transporter